MAINWLIDSLAHVCDSLPVDLRSPGISQDLFRKEAKDISLPHCLLTAHLLLTRITTL